GSPVVITKAVTVWVRSRPFIPGLEPHPDAPERGGSRPGSPVPDGPSRRKRTTRRWVFAVIGGVAAVAAIAAVVLATVGGPGQWLASPAAPQASQARPSPGTSTPSTPSSATPGGRSGTLPAGFSWYRDPTGFSIGVPNGWRVSHDGQVAYIRAPSGGRFLLIDQTTQPKRDPLADWRQQEAARISTYPGYHRIRIQAVHYPQAERAADWEFTYYRNGQLVHVLNRNILANAHHAYALYWSTPASEWNASFGLFRNFADTFRPAGMSLEG
ncbi:MAG TPA: hypothetical protein VIV12_27695, partial [Streptosporangiaceae bacterium]